MTRAKAKVFKSREAAIFLHHPSALTKANITRAKASEQYLQQAQPSTLGVQ